MRERHLATSRNACSRSTSERRMSPPSLCRRYRHLFAICSAFFLFGVG